jgi:dinuclear metal center YbgI/SA1388 family protein
MKIKEIISCLEKFAPPSLQEDYDNSGLLIGNPDQEISAILTTLDVTEDIIDEAIELKINLIVAHHPIIFSGLKKINGKNYVERIIIKAIQHSIAIYACHTNADNVYEGVNKKIADKLGLNQLNILCPKSNQLMKLVTFVPIDATIKVQEALFAAGAGNIGNYSECSFTVNGEGSFKPNEKSNPFLGEKHKLEKVNENRLEVIFEAHLQQQIMRALHTSHPYEEVAHYLHVLENDYRQIGSGMIGEFEAPMSWEDFFNKVKSVFSVPTIKHTRKITEHVKKIALCGGSGSFLLKHAIQQKADVFLSADFTYHKFFDAENKIVICDIGHFETEQFTPELFYEVIKENFPNFAVHLSKINTNPINYF